MCSDGKLIGVLLTDEFGNGKLKFSNRPDDDDELLFPGEIEVVEGSNASVEDSDGQLVLEGTFSPAVDD